MWCTSYVFSILLLGKQLTGEEAPLARELSSWLEAHPGWEQVEESTDEEEQGSDDEEGDEEKRESTSMFY